MRNYLQGQTYEFVVIAIRKDFGNNDYMEITDGDVSFRLYDIYPGQLINIPDKVFARVVSKDYLGKIKLQQDRAKFNEMHYQLDQVFTVQVIERKVDNNDHAFYRVEDDLAQHSLYYYDTPKYNAGDTVTVKVVGFHAKGFLKLEEVVDSSVTTATSMSVPSVNVNPDDVLDLGDESTKLELKTSIVFPPGNDGQPDIQKQMMTILKELASFMNAEGGKLYIGVHDKTNAVTGINKDYEHLNEDPTDNGTYGPTRDGFQLKIRNTVEKYCQAFALHLLEFEFEEKNGKDYCIITVKPSERPIWIKDTSLYQRVGNRVVLLKGDSITNFVSERLTKSIKGQLGAMIQQTISFDKIMEMFQEIINRPKPELPPLIDNSQEIDRWIIWYSDATWEMRREKKEDDQNVFCQIPILKGCNDSNLVFCYESGNINEVTYKQFKTKTKLNEIKQGGFYSENGVKPMNIFFAHPSDFLVGFSVDPHGVEYVKIHSLTDFRATASSSNMGSRFIPKDSKMTSFKVISSVVKDQVSRLVCKKSETTSNPGTPLDSVPLKKDIEIVCKL